MARDWVNASFWGLGQLMKLNVPYFKCPLQEARFGPDLSRQPPRVLGPHTHYNGDAPHRHRPEAGARLECRRNIGMLMYDVVQKGGCFYDHVPELEYEDFGLDNRGTLELPQRCGGGKNALDPFDRVFQVTSEGDDLGPFWIISDDGQTVVVFSQHGVSAVPSNTLFTK